MGVTGESLDTLQTCERNSRDLRISTDQLLRVVPFIIISISCDATTSYHDQTKPVRPITTLSRYASASSIIILIGNNPEITEALRSTS